MGAIPKQNLDRVQHRIQDLISRYPALDAAIAGVGREIGQGLLDDVIGPTEVSDYVDLIARQLEGTSPSDVEGRIGLALLALAIQQHVEHQSHNNSDIPDMALRARAITCVAEAFSHDAPGHARIFYEKAADAHLSLGDRVTVAQCIMCEGGCLHRLGKPVEAHAALRQAGAYFREEGRLGDAALCDMDAAICLAQSGKEDAALGILDSAGRALLEAGDLSGYASCCANQGTLLCQLERPEEALAICETALRTQGVEQLRSERGALLKTAADCHLRMQRLSQAEELYRGAEQLLSSPSAAMGTCLMSLAACLEQLERPWEALELCETALPMIVAYGTPLDTARGQKMYAICLARFGWFARALQHVDAALEILARASSALEFGDLHMHRANLLVQLHRPGEALIAYDQSERFLNDRSASVDFARLLTNKAYCLDTQGRTGDAVELFNRAAAILREHAPSRTLAYCLLNHGRCLAAQGEVLNARAELEEALSICESLPYPADEIRWRTCINLALVLFNESPPDLGQLESLLARALAIVDNRGAMPTRVLDRVGLRETYSDAYRLMIRLELLRGRGVAGFDLTQRAKGRSLLDLLKTLPEDDDRDVEDSLMREANLLRQLQSASSENIPHVRDALAHLRDERARLRGNPMSEQKRTQPGDAETVRTLEEIRRFLAVDEALLDMVDTGQAIAVFVVTSGGLVDWYQVPHDAIEQVRARLRSQWDIAAVQHTGTPEAPAIPALSELYDLLLARAAAAHPDAKHLILSPAGAILDLPFAALVKTEANGEQRFASQVFVLSTIPTGSTLCVLRGRRKRSAGAPPLLAAAPFPSGIVAATQAEICEVARIHERAYANAERSVLMGEYATLEAVERHAPMSDVIVLATHGERARDAHGLRDFRIRFAQARDGTDSSLGMREVFDGRLSLPNAVSVALTACHLGGVALHGDEALGFQQAFLAAGAQTVLAPLWEVDDKATAALSVEYHRALIEGEQPVGTAWQLAMSKVRSCPKWAHPQYWSCILPSGDAATALRVPSGS